MNKRSIMVLAGVLILAVIGGLSAFINEGDAVPISAEGMTEDERAEIDTNVLTEELADYDVDQVMVNYSGGTIGVYIDKPKSEQYVDEYAQDVIEAVSLALVDRKANMTLEKGTYHVYVYGNDGLILTSLD